MTIKELEQRTGLPRTSIRFYEQEELLHPERRENNYRDYSEEDVRTLKKIKLLRQLSLDLEDIRRLQAGELPLGQALSEQALVLEGDRADLERYAQVCEELSRAGATYESLEPEPWLTALEEESLPLSRRVDPAKQDTIAAAPYPWRRFFARMLDLTLAGALWVFFQYFIFHQYSVFHWDLSWPEGVVALLVETSLSTWVSWFLLLLLEPILLCTWGYTPGKWLLRLKVRQEDGQKLEYLDALNRTFRVFWQGCGFGILLIYEACMLYRQTQCSKDQVMPWDRGLSYTVRPVKGHRIAVFVLTYLLASFSSSFLYDLSWRLPNPSGPLTPEQVVENYNFLEQLAESVWGERPKLALEPDGRWREAPPAYQEGWVWLELENSEWGPVEFTTDEAGYVTGFSVTWSPKGNPYGEELELWWPTTEFLPNLFLALSPGAEGWSFPWEETFSEKRIEAVGLTLALDKADFSQAGSTLSEPWEDLGGLTGTVEVLDSQGYQSTVQTGRLLQEDPGTGTLTIRFAAALPD